MNCSGRGPIRITNSRSGRQKSTSVMEREARRRAERQKQTYCLIGRHVLPVSHPIDARHRVGCIPNPPQSTTRIACKVIFFCDTERVRDSRGNMRAVTVAIVSRRRRSGIERVERAGSSQSKLKMRDPNSSIENEDMHASAGFAVSVEVVQRRRRNKHPTKTVDPSVLARWAAVWPG